MSNQSNDIQGKASEVLRAFSKLGCTAFGGPIAHLGFFRQEFVERRRWLDERSFADLVSLCQFLPGPASSQVALALGWRRAGYAGAACAWLGFTMPSAMIMLGFAYGIRQWSSFSHSGWMHGLKIAAVAVVAQALWLMARRLCPDWSRRIMAVLALCCLILIPAVWMQLAVIGGGALAGWLFSRHVPGAPKEKMTPTGPSRYAGTTWLVIFFGLLLGLPLIVHAWPTGWLKVVDAFYRAGALVFGGGHVVLPLLEKATVGHGWINHDTFLSGYGAAQALPGPLFTFAAYLGSSLNIGPGGIAGGILALLSIYLPSVLLIFGVMPHWDRLRQISAAQAMLAGTNAAVVGLLAAALYSPIGTSALTDVRSWVLAVAAFGGLVFAKLPPWLVVLLCAAAGKFLFT